VEIHPVTECQRDVPASAPALAAPFLNSPRKLFIVLGAIFLVHVVIRLITSRSAGLDESEQLVFSQTWAWGYGPQPPLYSWLQILVFKIFGPSILGLALLKNALLFVSYACTYGAGRIVTRSHVGGLLSTLGLFFIPQISWESHRELTHSVLAMTISTATVLVFFRLHDSRAPRLYAGLGVLFGLGMLSNYNYAILLVGLILAALCLKEFRPVVLSPWMALSAAVALLLLAPHLQWVVRELPVVLSTSHKLRIRSQDAFVIVASRAIGSLIEAWLSHVIGIVAVMAILCWKQFGLFQRDILRRPPVRFLLLLICIALLGVTAVMIATRATSFKGRWLQPLLFCVSILFAALLEPRLLRQSLARIVSAAAAILLSVMFLLPARVWFAGEVGRDSGLDTPYAKLVQRLQPEIEQADTIVADSLALGGNLRMLVPEKRVMTPQFAPWRSDGEKHRTVVVFDASLANGLPPDLRPLLSSAAIEMKPEEFRYVDMPPLPGSKQSQRFAVALLR
jgi:4-amino-4-deoxy-L-arabinose transferase-like glycosyltransferase